MVVGTDNVRTGELLKALYAPYARSREKVIVMGVRSAEMTKYAANCMLATKISFINEVANICEKVGADVIDTPVNGDFSPITLTDADIQEITLPRWIRAVGGDAILEGVQ